MSLEARSGLAPVAIAVFDGGVDPAVFPGRIWTSAKEVPGNAKDDAATATPTRIAGAMTLVGEPGA